MNVIYALFFPVISTLINTMALFLMAAGASANTIVFETFDLKKTSIEIIAKPAKGLTVSEVTAVITEETPRYLIINGPIFDINYQPLGLFVNDGKEINPLNERYGPGNFFFSNGVFSIKDGNANVSYRANYKCKNVTPDFAIQSGPVLITNEKMNHKINRKVTSAYTRSAIGVTMQDELFVAYSTNAMTLYDFTSELLNQYQAKSALFLDGTIVSAASNKSVFNADQRLYSVLKIIEE